MPTGVWPSGRGAIRWTDSLALRSQKRRGDVRLPAVPVASRSAIAPGESPGANYCGRSTTGQKQLLKSAAAYAKLTAE